MWNSAVLSVIHQMMVAQTDNGGETTSPSSPFGSMWIFLVGFAAIMYFFMIRPQQKREKERREMLSAVSKGDRVVTNGGLFGTVVGLTEKTMVLRVSEDPNVKIEFLRGAVSRAVSHDEDDEDEGG